MDLQEKFGFLTKLRSLENDEISAACRKTATFYADLNAECEIVKFDFFADQSTIISHSQMYSKIIEDELQTVFPNIEIILRIFLTL